MGGVAAATATWPTPPAGDSPAGGATRCVWQHHATGGRAHGPPPPHHRWAPAGVRASEHSSCMCVHMCHSVAGVSVCSISRCPVLVSFVCVGCGWVCWREGRRGRREAAPGGGGAGGACLMRGDGLWRRCVLLQRGGAGRCGCCCCGCCCCGRWR